MIGLKNSRLNLLGLGGFSYALMATRINSVTRSNASKSLIVMGIAPFQGLRLTAYRIDSTCQHYII